MVYTMTIAGVQRDLPICRVSDELYIGAFVIFGDVELTVKTATALLENTPMRVSAAWLERLRTKENSRAKSTLKITAA